ALMSPPPARKRVLMITYVFPPSGWVGGRRTHKYCKYLGAHGWEPLVLTAKPAAGAFLDNNLLRQLPPDLRVYRTLDVDPAKWEEGLAARATKRAVARGEPPPGTVPPPPDYRPGPWARAKSFIKSLLKESPDSHLFWVPFAFLTGVRVMLSRKVDVIYCSTPP